MILERAHKSWRLMVKVIQAGKFDNKSTAEEQEAMLRALIEKEDERRQKGGTDEEEEDLDDDELNQIIARNENELVVFRKMDEERYLATKNAPYPSRLYTEEELPEIYKIDQKNFSRKKTLHWKSMVVVLERKILQYDDNLTEEQWLKKIEGMVSDDDDDDDDGNVDMSDSEMEAKPKKPKGRRGRKPKVARVEDEESQTESDVISVKRQFPEDADDFIPQRDRNLLHQVALLLRVEAEVGAVVEVVDVEEAEAEDLCCLVIHLL